MAVDESIKEAMRAAGKAGGLARTKSLSAKELTRIGKLGAKARWAGKRGKKGSKA